MCVCVSGHPAMTDHTQMAGKFYKCSEFKLKPDDRTSLNLKPVRNKFKISLCGPDPTYMEAYIHQI